MGINTADGVPLRIFFFPFLHFFFGKMILPISLWLILSAVVVTARMDKPGGEIINNVDKAAASTEEGDKEIMQPALDRHRLRDMDWDTKDTGNERSSKKLSAEKKEIKAKMADEDIEDEAESGEVDDAKSNKVALRQNDCNNCRSFIDCFKYCKGEEANDNDFPKRSVGADNCEQACLSKLKPYLRGSPSSCYNC